MSDLHPAEQRAREAAAERDAALAREPERRKAHGVVHTPPEIARCVLAIVDELAERELELPQGASDPRLTFIDPACGPGAFLAAALRLWAARGEQAGLQLRGLDLDPDALASAAALASHAPPGFGLHRSDVLREPLLLELAAGAQRERRALAIAGNPPWITARSDKTVEMQALLEDFRRDGAGARLPERKLGVLSDAYVRFVRVCAEAARRSDTGAVVALVTNGSFLDGPVHRGMRSALARWFDRLYLLDLGGSALLQRTAADARERDDNVFGVRPSVAISWLCRRPGPGDRTGEVYYARLRGTAAHKHEVLAGARLDALGFTRLSPVPPLARFVPRRGGDGEYETWPSLAEWLPFHREGVQTNRDRAAIDCDRDRLLERLRAFVRGASLPELARANDDQAHYRAHTARHNVAAALERDPDGSLGLSVRPLAYRPFDRRWFCPVAPLCHRPRPDLLLAIDREPSVLVAVRKDRGFTPYTHFGATDIVIDNCFLSTRSSCRARAFPAHTPDGLPNLSSELAARCGEVAAEMPSVHAFQAYALAVLASPAYRRRFDEPLHADYPRLPLPSSAEAWRGLVACGERVRRAWTDPPPELEAAAGPVGLRCSELRLSAADGCIRIGSERVLEVEPPVLSAWLGHGQPFKQYLTVHASETLTMQHWSDLRGLAWRVQEIIAAGADADVWLRQSGRL